MVYSAVRKTEEQWEEANQEYQDHRDHVAHVANTAYDDGVEMPEIRSNYQAAAPPGAAVHADAELGHMDGYNAGPLNMYAFDDGVQSYHTVTRHLQQVRNRKHQQQQQQRHHHHQLHVRRHQDQMAPYADAYAVDHRATPGGGLPTPRHGHHTTYTVRQVYYDDVDGMDLYIEQSITDSEVVPVVVVDEFSDSEVLQNDIHHRLPPNGQTYD